jgi:hypothetical protein
VAKSAKVSKTIIAMILNGKRKNIRRQAELRILAVRSDAHADHALIPAKETWLMINKLLREGFSKRQLAKRLGYKKAIQFKRDFVLKATEIKIRRFYKMIMAI